MNYVKGEKFKSLEEALLWCAENKPIYNSRGHTEEHSINIQVFTATEYWSKWHKAIKAPEKKMKAFYLWMKPRSGDVTSSLYCEERRSVLGTKLIDSYSVRLDWSKTMIEVEGE